MVFKGQMLQNHHTKLHLTPYIEHLRIQQAAACSKSIIKTLA